MDYRMMRKLIIETAVTSRMKEAEEKAIAMFQNLMKNNVTVEPNLRFIAYTTGVRLDLNSHFKSQIFWYY